jgi:Protein of unknown function (DUF2934)
MRSLFLFKTFSNDRINPRKEVPMPRTRPTPPAQTDNVVTLRPSVDRRPALQDEIAQRAYELYESGGRIDGADLNDWLQAEREIISEQTKAS